MTFGSAMFDALPDIGFRAAAEDRLSVPADGNQDRLNIGDTLNQGEARFRPKDIHGG